MRHVRQASGRTWSVVLAAGRGTRLGRITRAICGRELPKQFTALTSQQTLLQETMNRSSMLAPAPRTVVVVSDEYAEIARQQLRGYPGAEIVVQPLDRGTGAGVFLGLAHIQGRDPNAEVVVFPSDHHFRRPDALVEAVQRGWKVARRAPSEIALLGAPAERPATDLGWIVPGNRILGGGFEVSCFVEKPAEETALSLLQSRALWNTMVIVGTLRGLWRLGGAHLPQQLDAFESYSLTIGRQGSARLLRYLYERMETCDFSRRLLERSAGLGLVEMVDSGWFDCGTPERLLAWLSAEADPLGLLKKLQGDAAVLGMDDDRDSPLVARA